MDDFRREVQKLDDLREMGFLPGGDDEYKERRAQLAMELGVTDEDGGEGESSADVGADSVDLGVLPPPVVDAAADEGENAAGNLAAQIAPPAAAFVDHVKAEDVSGVFENAEEGSHADAAYWDPRRWRDEADEDHNLRRRYYEPELQPEITRAEYEEARAALKKVSESSLLLQQRLYPAVAVESDVQAVKHLDVVRQGSAENWRPGFGHNVASPAWRVGQAGAQTSGSFVQGGHWDAPIRPFSLHETFPFLVDSEYDMDYFQGDALTGAEMQTFQKDYSQALLTRENHARRWARLELCVGLGHCFLTKHADHVKYDDYVKHDFIGSVQRVVSVIEAGSGDDDNAAAPPSCFLCGAERDSDLFCQGCGDTDAARLALQWLAVLREREMESFRPIEHHYTEGEFHGWTPDEAVDDRDEFEEAVAQYGEAPPALYREKRMVPFHYGGFYPHSNFSIDMRPAGYADDNHRFQYVPLNKWHIVCDICATTFQRHRQMVRHYQTEHPPTEIVAQLYRIISVTMDQAEADEALAILRQFGPKAKGGSGEINPDVTINNEGMFPIHFAAQRDQTGTFLRALIEEFDVEVNIRNAERETPLHRAVTYRAPAHIFEILLYHGGNPNASGGPNRRTVLEDAEEAMLDAAIIEMLEDPRALRQVKVKSAAKR